MIKVLGIIGLERTDLNSGKAACDKATANSILGRENLKAIPLESRTRQDVYFIQSFSALKLIWVSGGEASKNGLEGSTLEKPNQVAAH